MMAAPTWTPEERAELRKLWSDGLSAGMIGNAMGRTRNSIIGQVHRTGLPRRKTLSTLPKGTGWRKPREPRTAAKPKPAPTGRKSIKGVSQPGWRAPEAIEALEYEVERRANGAMAFIDIRNKTHGFCKWFLHGEAGKDGLQCCARIPVGLRYCEHHRARNRAAGTNPWPYREAAE